MAAIRLRGLLARALLPVPCAFVLVADPAVVHATTPRWCDEPIQPVAPDPIHVADSAVGIAVARCVRAPHVLPARFTLERLLAGTLPDSFTVRGPGWYYAGERCVLVLTQPPRCVRSTPAGHRRYVEDFDAINVPQITGEAPGLPPMSAEAVAAAGRIAGGFWGASTLSERELQERVRSWVLPRDDCYGPSPATEALLRHPELRDSVLEDTLLRWVRRPDSAFDRERAARALGLRPDPATRATARVLARGKGNPTLPSSPWLGDDADRYIAVLLTACDTLPEARKWLVSMLQEPNDLVAETAIRALQPTTRPAERRALITFALQREDSVGKLAGGVPVVELPESLGSSVFDQNHLRIVALQQLGSDTSAVVRKAIDRMLHEQPDPFSSGEEAPFGLYPDSLTPCWTETELRESLSDPSPRIRELACKEAGRRQDRRAGQIILEALRVHRLPNGAPLQADEVVTFLGTLGEIRDTSAVPELVRQVDLAHFMVPFAKSGHWPYRVRHAALRALGSFNDPRALAVLRCVAESTLTRSACDPDQRAILWDLAGPLANIGEPGDVRFFEFWAERCPDNVVDALKGIAILAGPGPMFVWYEKMLRREPQVRNWVSCWTLLREACRRR